LVVRKEAPDLIRMAIIQMCIDRIAVHCHNSFCLKSFGETFRTYPILHARSMWFVGTASTMNHAMLDDFKEGGVAIGIRPCGAYDIINFFAGLRAELREKG